jgi:HEAT repeat protein
MRDASVVATLVLTIAIAALVLLILAQQIVHRIKRRARLILRPACELALAEYLADENAVGPPPPRSRREQVVLRQVALAALIEVRGRERARLTELLERTGIVACTVTELGARRRITRRRAADMLAEIRSEHARSALVTGLGDSDPATRLGCARALVEVRDGDSADRVVEVAAADADTSPGAVGDVFLGIAAWKPSLLGGAMSTATSPALRRMLAAIVGELRLAEHAALLRAALDDPDDELASRSARGLGLIGDDASVETLARVLGDTGRVQRVRATAAMALGWIGDRRALASLRTAASSPDWAVSTAAADALVLLGADPAATPAPSADTEGGLAVAAA